METKHTPGPWLIVESTVYALNERRPPVNRFHASVDAGFDNCDKRISRAEVEANAKLITAAPDLLAAAIDVLNGLNDRIDAAVESRSPTPVFEGIAALHDAINKAIA